VLEEALAVAREMGARVMSFHDVAAILGMLQTCSPGLSVVNVDNGVGAGATAALIANRAALGRTTRRNSHEPD
jgi:NCAIR mutase (PurE)-related protein